MKYLLFFFAPLCLIGCSRQSPEQPKVEVMALSSNELHVKDAPTIPVNVLIRDEKGSNFGTTLAFQKKHKFPDGHTASAVQVRSSQGPATGPTWNPSPIPGAVPQSYPADGLFWVPKDSIPMYIYADPDFNKKHAPPGWNIKTGRWDSKPEQLRKPLRKPLRKSDP